MSNPVEICNVALGRINKPRINSLNDQTVEALTCRTFYDFCRQACLSDAPWNFASKFLALSLLTETNTGWLYVYSYPGDCATAREIINPAADQSSYSDINDQIPFEVGLSVTGNFNIIMTNQIDAVLKYTADISNAGIFSASFSDALAWRLAAELCLPLRLDLQVAQAVRQAYSISVANARTNSANEGRKAPTVRNSIVDSRDMWSTPYGYATANPSGGIGGGNYPL